MNTQTKLSQIDIKVMAINLLYQASKIILDYEQKHFSQFIGQNIFKVDGSVKAKFQHEKIEVKIPIEGVYTSVSYWFEKRGSYSFDINVKICVNGGSYDVQPSTAFCQYQNESLTLFKLENECLTPTNIDREYLNEVFDSATLIEQANKIKALAEVYREEANKLNYMFKDVLFIERLTR